MLPIFVIFFQCINNDMQMFFISQEISIGSINEKCFYSVLFYIVSICFLQAEQVLISYILLIKPVPFFYVLLKLLHGAMQVDQQIWLQQLLVYDLKQSLIKPEFIFRQVHFGK